MVSNIRFLSVFYLIDNTSVKFKPKKRENAKMSFPKRERLYSRFLGLNFTKVWIIEFSLKGHLLCDYCLNTCENFLLKKTQNLNLI